MTVARFPYDPAAGLHIGGRAFGLPAAPAAAPPEPGELEWLVRFEHPAKLLAVADLPGGAALPPDAVAAAYACEPEALADCRARLDDAAAATAAGLLSDAGLRAAVAELPVAARGTLVALGDSITDDLLSWAELLRRCLERARPEDEIVVVNAGVSGDTSADVLRRLHAVAALGPDLVVTMLGTNDCQRHGPDAARLVAHAETARNLAAIDAWLESTGAARAWITPPPVDEAALAGAVGERPFSIRDEDVARVAEAVRALGGPVVDAHSLLRREGALLADGVHPSASGQAIIAAALIAALARSSQNHSGAGKP